MKHLLYKDCVYLEELHATGHQRSIDFDRPVFSIAPFGRGYFYGTEEDPHRFRIWYDKKTGSYKVSERGDVFYTATNIQDVKIAVQARVYEELGYKVEFLPGGEIRWVKEEHDSDQ